MRYNHLAIAGLVLLLSACESVTPVRSDINICPRTNEVSVCKSGAGTLTITPTTVEVTEKDLNGNEITVDVPVLKFKTGINQDVYKQKDQVLYCIAVQKKLTNYTLQTSKNRTFYKYFIGGDFGAIEWYTILVNLPVELYCHMHDPNSNVLDTMQDEPKAPFVKEEDLKEVDLVKPKDTSEEFLDETSAVTDESDEALTEAFEKLEDSNQDNAVEAISNEGNAVDAVSNETVETATKLNKMPDEEIETAVGHIL